MKKYVFLNPELLRQVNLAAVREQQPFPWVSFEKLIMPDGFERLSQEFPALEWFEKHENRPRKTNQRPHNRFYLEYHQVYFSAHKRQPTACIKHHDLSPDWQQFITELKSPEYLQFLTHFFGTSAFHLQFSWHIGITHSEVSPHCDWVGKLGTNLFYFNTQHDWSESWGGQIIVLGGKQTEAMNPEFEDFETQQAIPFLDNRSVLFQNSPSSWHGVRPLTCPEGKYRRLFNVIPTRLSRPQQVIHQVKRLTQGLGLKKTGWERWHPAGN